MLSEGMSPEEVAEIGARREFTEEHNFQPLNEILSYHLLPEADEVYIHLAPARTLEKAQREDLVIGGLKVLANHLATHPELQSVKKVGAISWIVTKRPELLTSLGFTIDGPIPKEMQERLFPHEKIQVGAAHINRDQFLELYG